MYPILASGVLAIPTGCRYHLEKGQAVVRINRDIASWQLAKEIIVEIVRASGGTFQGKTRLYKAFLLAHLIYFRDYDRILSNWPLVHMPNGHGIDRGDELVDELMQEGRLKPTKQWIGPYPEHGYSVSDRGGSSKLQPEAQRAIEKAVQFVQTKSATELSQLIHEHSRSYQEGRPGEELNIYVDLIEDEQFEADREKIDAISRLVAKVFRK